MQAEKGAQPFWQVYQLYGRPSDVHWHAIWPQIPKLLALFMVVAFGSSMDMAAIQQDMPVRQLDYDRELMTVGERPVQGFYSAELNFFVALQPQVLHSVLHRLNGLCCMLP